MGSKMSFRYYIDVDVNLGIVPNFLLRKINPGELVIDLLGIKKRAMAKNGSSRCFLAKNGCTLKTIVAESVGRI